MKRLFITTDFTKAKAMYNRTGHEARKVRVETDFLELPKQYVYNELTIVVIKDDFTEWSNYNINKEVDYILYHKNSNQVVINTIKASFDTYKDGHHELDELHDHIYRVIFDENENNKVSKILQAYGFDPKLEELLLPFTKANPFKTTNNEGEDLKNAKEVLNNYIKNKLDAESFHIKY